MDPGALAALLGTTITRRSVPGVKMMTSNSPVIKPRSTSLCAGNQNVASSSFLRAHGFRAQPGVSVNGSCVPAGWAVAAIVLEWVFIIVVLAAFIIFLMRWFSRVHVQRNDDLEAAGDPFCTTSKLESLDCDDD